MRGQNTLFDGLLSRSDVGRTFVLPLGNGTGMTYGDVLSTSAQYAHALVDVRVRPGDRVAVQAPKSLEMLMLYLGVIRAGAVFLPLNTAYVADELSYFVADAEPHVFVGAPGVPALDRLRADFPEVRIETLGASPGEGSFVALRQGKPANFDNVARGPDDLAAILYTSGTTGRSKGAMLSHDNLLSNAKVLADHWRFADEDRLLHTLPIFHTHGLFVATNVVLLSGASMIFLPGFDLDAVIDALPKSTVMMGVPTFYTRLLADPRLDREGTAAMRLFVSGSAPLLAETHRAFEDRTGHLILERYGMTETNMITSNPYDGARRAGTVGKPLPSVEVRITDAQAGQPMPTGEVGMIEVRGPNVFQGYWRMPDKTAAELRQNGFFITGDLGVFDEAGYLTIVGREKDLIISGGYNIYPKEIEQVLDAHEGVRESAIVAAPHSDFGEGVVAVVVPVDGNALTSDELTRFLSPKLAAFKRPKHIAFVDELPRNAMGKVQKSALRDIYRDVFE